MQRSIPRKRGVLHGISNVCLWHAVNDEENSQMKQAEFNARFSRRAGFRWHSHC
jgi:hypothetical protein